MDTHFLGYKMCIRDRHIVILMESPGNGNGRLDQFLWPYLKADLEKGIITMEEARDLIGEMFLRLDERWVMKEYELDIYLEVLTVGGCNKDGSSCLLYTSSVHISTIISLTGLISWIIPAICPHIMEPFSMSPLCIALCTLVTRRL